MALAVIRERLRFALFACALAGCGESGGVPPVAEVTSRRELVQPGAPHAAHVTDPALAVAPDGAPVLAWIRRDESGETVRAAVLRGDDADPVRVDPAARPVAGGHQPPGLTVTADGRVHVSWASPRRDPGGSPFASDLVLASSADGGKSYEAPLRVSEDRPGSRGFESLASDASGGVVAVWIESGAGPGAATRAARVANGAVAEIAELGSQTCPCCRISVATDGAGRVGVLWRDELPGRVRDMVFAISEKSPLAFAASERVHDDGWVFDACPHRGGSLAFAPDGRAVAAWYSEGRKREPALWLATRDTTGRFSLPIPFHDGAGTLPDRVALAIGADGSGLVLWERRSPVRSEIAARAWGPDGRPGASRVLSRGVHASGPALAASPGGFTAAWNEEEFPVLRTVVVRLALSFGP